MYELVRPSKIAHDRIIELKNLEEANNKIFIDAYSITEDITITVDEADITLSRADRNITDCP